MFAASSSEDKIGAVDSTKNRDGSFHRGIVAVCESSLCPLLVFSWFSRPAMHFDFHSFFPSCTKHRQSAPAQLVGTLRVDQFSYGSHATAFDIHKCQESCGHHHTQTNCQSGGRSSHHWLVDSCESNSIRPSIVCFQEKAK